MSTPRYLYLSTTWICQSQHNTVISCHRKIRLLFFSSPFRQAQCEPRHLKKSATIPTQDVDVSSHLAVMNILPRLADAAIQADASQLLHHKTVLLRAARWKVLLAHHPNRDFASYLINGLEKGYIAG